MKVLFFQIKSKITRSGTAPIFCRITLDKERKQFSTGITVKPIHFQEGVFTGHPNAIEYNQHLNAITGKLFRSYSFLLLSEEWITPQSIYQVFQNGVATKKHLITTVVNEYYETNVKKVAGKQITSDTLRSYRHRQDRFLDYLRKTKKHRFLTDFGLKELQKYGEYLSSEGLSVSYLRKCCLYVKQVYNYANCEDYLNDSRIQKYSTAHPKKKELIYLTPDQIVKLENTDFHHLQLNATRDLFLFQVYTGMAFVDARNFRRELIQQGKNKQTFVFYNRKKTGEQAIIPYTPKLDLLLKRLDYITPRKSLHKYNYELKLICANIGVKDKITSHTGRVSCAMTYLNDGFTFRAVAKILGHSNEQTTRDWYARVSEYLLTKEYNGVYGATG